MYYEIAFLKVLLIYTGDITIQIPYFSQINLLMRFGCSLATIPCSVVKILWNSISIAHSMARL